MAVTLMAASSTVNAKIIEHSGDRYIINVDEMELNGEETVLDVLMMCPEIMSQNGRTTSSPYYMGNYAVRINNINIQMNEEMFLKNTKAKEIKKIKVCINPGVMKGSGNMKKVIDLYFRKNEKGTHGKVAVEADYQASGEVFGRIINQSDKAWIQGMVAGEMAYKYEDGTSTKSRAAREDANVNVDWDITSKDNLLLQATQTYGRGRENGEPAATYNRTVSATACYTRSLADNGAYAMVQVAADYTTYDDKVMSNRSTAPYGLVEFGFPFIHKNIYVTAGIEAGYSAATDLMANYTDRDMYEDVYAQVDWTCGKWGVMVGDRFRANHFWMSQLEKYNNIAPWEHTTSNNYFTASVWCNVDDHNTIQGTFARRFYGVSGDNYVFNTVDAKRDFIYEAYQCPIYVSEVRYTYQQHNFNLMGFVKNENKKISEKSVKTGSDNILTTGVSAFVHAGVLRLTAGVDYNWERLNKYGVGAEYSNWVSCHIAPQVSLNKGWRFTANAIYNSRRMSEKENYIKFYKRPNFYLDVAASKEINKHWLVEAKWHDIVDTRVGNRSVSIGGTYSF